MPLRTMYIVCAGRPSSAAVNFESSGRHGSLIRLIRGSNSRVPTRVAPPGSENTLRPSSALRASNDMPPESRRSATACASRITGYAPAGSMRALRDSDARRMASRAMRAVSSRATSKWLREK